MDANGIVEIAGSLHPQKAKAVASVATSKNGRMQGCGTSE
jgi:hypothetical protein